MKGSTRSIRNIESSTVSKLPMRYPTLLILGIRRRPNLHRGVRPVPCAEPLLRGLVKLHRGVLVAVGPHLSSLSKSRTRKMQGSSFTNIPRIKRTKTMHRPLFSLFKVRKKQGIRAVVKYTGYSMYTRGASSSAGRRPPTAPRMPMMVERVPEVW